MALVLSSGWLDKTATKGVGDHLEKFENHGVVFVLIFYFNCPSMQLMRSCVTSASDTWSK